MSLAILFHFLCAQHVSDINISIQLAIFSVELPHWSYCSRSNQQYDQCGNSTEKIASSSWWLY